MVGKIPNDERTLQTHDPLDAKLGTAELGKRSPIERAPKKPEPTKQDVKAALGLSGSVRDAAAKFAASISTDLHSAGNPTLADRIKKDGFAKATGIKGGSARSAGVKRKRK